LPEHPLRSLPTSIAEARQRVRDRLGTVLEPEKLSEGELLTSELVTTAVRYAQVRDEAAIEVDFEIEGQDGSRNPRRCWSRIRLREDQFVRLRTNPVNGGSCSSRRWPTSGESTLSPQRLVRDRPITGRSTIGFNLGRLDRRRTPDWPPPDLGREARMTASRSSLTDMASSFPARWCECA
jgi:hypothetical protein